MKFDHDLIERIRASTNIVELIGGYLRLRKQGQNFVALCPFHSEKTPSFSVNEGRQIFKCFGCGKGGDIFSFVQEIENLSFPEAVAFLAQRCGISIREEPAQSDENSARRNRLLKVMAAAADYFRENLSGNMGARQYLEDRCIGEETISRFGLGFALPGSHLLSHLTSQGFSRDDLEECGLIVAGDSGEFYDKFRNRIMFPIVNLSGQVIAFGGRVIGDARPKYLNSPETVLYSKGHNLYGLHTARDAIRKRGFAVLVEGYFDCIVPSQFGVENIVASLGTALTESQVRLLGRHTRQVVVNFDPDSAGMTAATRSVDLFLSQGFHVNVVHLPEGTDPDSYILSKGVESYLAQLKQSVPFIEFLLDYHLGRQRNPESPSAKQAVTNLLLPYLARLPNRVERVEYLARVAARLHVPESVLIAEMRRFSRRGESRQEPLSVLSDKQEPTLAEKHLIAGLAGDETRELILKAVELEIFEGLRSQTFFERLLDPANRNALSSVFDIRGVLEGDDLDLFDRLSVQSSDPPITEETIRQSVAAIREIWRGRQVRRRREEIGRLEKEGGDDARIDVLLREIEALQRAGAS